MSYDNTNTGVLFKNDKKEEGDNKPNYTGKINIEGTERYLSAWIKEGKSGKFMSLSLGKPVEQKKGQDKPKSKPAPARSEFVDDNLDEVPF